MNRLYKIIKEAINDEINNILIESAGVSDEIYNYVENIYKQLIRKFNAKPWRYYKDDMYVKLFTINTEQIPYMPNGYQAIFYGYDPKVMSKSRVAELVNLDRTGTSFGDWIRTQFVVPLNFNISDRNNGVVNEIFKTLNHEMMHSMQGSHYQIVKNQKAYNKAFKYRYDDSNSIDNIIKNAKNKYLKKVAELYYKLTPTEIDARIQELYADYGENNTALNDLMYLSSDCELVYKQAMASKEDYDKIDAGCKNIGINTNQFIRSLPKKKRYIDRKIFRAVGRINMGL